jgi:hypothetical protein
MLTTRPPARHTSFFYGFSGVNSATGFVMYISTPANSCQYTRVVGEIVRINGLGRGGWERVSLLGQFIETMFRSSRNILIANTQIAYYSGIQVSRRVDIINCP